MNNTTTKTQKEPTRYSTKHKNTWVFDPGKTTGVAKFIDNFLFWWGEFHDWDEFERAICQGDAVVYESVHWRGVAFNPIGIEVIGVIKYLCHLNNIVPIEQQPSQINGVRKWPIYNWSSVKSPHAKDAICHGIVYFGNQVILPEKLLNFKTSDH
jgi:hypothetical protein